MMHGAGYVCNQFIRTSRFIYKAPSDNQISLELKRHFSGTACLSNVNRNPFSAEYTSLSSIVKRLGMKLKPLREIKAGINEKLAVFGEILTEQFNFYASQRVRRMSQVWNLYTRLYTEKTFKRIVSQFVKTLRIEHKRPVSFLLGIALFSWEKEKITDDELQSSIQELDNFHGPCLSSSKAAMSSDTGFTNKLKEEGWEAVIQKDRIQLWRKAFPNSYLYEYKIFGTFFDVPARAFFSIQTDVEYRKKWDKLVIKLDVIDKEDNCEVVHWVMHYPCPMYSREYVYIRRTMVDPESNAMVLVSRAVDHPDCPVNKKYVRVTKYSSRMVIRPHCSFDENGFDYILTYFDDPQAAFPSAAYNWMASSGIPDFVERLHDAARELHFEQKRNKTVTQSVPSTECCPAGDVEYAYM